MKRLIPFVVAAGMALGGCASGGGDMPSASAHNDKDAASAIMAAEQELSKATAIGNAWRDTGDIIKKAQAAAKAGKYDEAVKLAGIAQRQSEHALAQAEAQKDAGPRM